MSQIFVIFSFFIVFKVSEKIFNDKILGILSVLLLEGIYFYNFTTPEFNVNVCQLPFWSLVVYFSWEIFDKKTINFYDITYIAIFEAIVFLSKYLLIYILITVFDFYIKTIEIIRIIFCDLIRNHRIIRFLQIVSIQH